MSLCPFHSHSLVGEGEGGHVTVCRCVGERGGGGGGHVTMHSFVGS